MNRILTNTPCLPQMIVTSGTIETLKWMALVMMTCDHINKYLLNGTVAWLYDLGRLAMPLFIFVLAYNLARPGGLEHGVHQRIIRRLAIFGVLASPAFLALGGLANNWWPLNILFTLLVLVATIRFIETKTTYGYILAALVFCLGGSLVEFWWPALAFGLAIWAYVKQPSFFALGLALASCAALGFINGNQWAIASLFFILAAPFFALPCTRVRWFFYAYYPAHLTIIWLVRIPLRQAGYLFFT